MCKGLIGKKLGMTGMFSSQGRHVPITVLQVGPCVVTQVKTLATDGYNALQVGFGTRKASRVNKPLAGHQKKSGAGPFAVLREFAVDNPAEYQVGQTLPLEAFKVGERVDVTGISKGRGFSGVIKRHGFHGGKQTHGCMSRRVPGSIGASAWPSRVVKGRKLPGQYGNARVTARNLQIVDIRPEENLILVSGAVPGATTGIVAIRKPKIVKRKQRVK